MLIIDKSSLRKIPAPDQLFIMFIDTGLMPYPCIHKTVSQDKQLKTISIKHRFEGCAILTQQEVDEIISKYPKTNWKLISLAEIATELPVYINFPEGHPLHNNNVEIRAVNGSLDFRELLNLKK